MQPTRFVLTPFYEIVDTMVPLGRLKINDMLQDDKSQRYLGRQFIEFSVQYNHSLLLSESKRQKLSSFNIRSIIRFGKSSEMACDDHGIIMKDIFPIHLHIDLNNTIISLPNLLPNDRHGKDGRRFPRPVDLSEGLIDNPIIINRIDISWVQDDLKNDEYFYAIYLVRLRSCDELTSVLMSNHISPLSTSLGLVQHQCINLNGEVDDDLMLLNSSISISLNCPVSRGRIDIPIRGRDCKHLQCFDCMTYLVMNFKKPTWQCPVCDKTTFFCYLEVDGLMINILSDERSKSVENILFNKSGQWKPEKKIPGTTNDDQPYSEISDYPKLKENNFETKSNPLQVLNESLKDDQIEKYLQLIIKNSKQNASLLPEKIQYNMTNLNQPNPSPTVNSNPILIEQFKKFSNVQFNHNPNFKEQFFQSGKSLYSYPNLPRYPNSVVAPHDDTNFQSKISQNSNFISPQTQKAFHDQMNVRQRGAHPTPPQYQYDYLPQHLSKPPDDGTSKIQITNVTSMATSQKVVKDIIVISDDEVEDGTISNKCKTYQKRPTMASSVPTDVGSCKQLKLSNPTTSRPNSVRVSSVQSQSCKCTPERICPAHINLDECIDGIIKRTYATEPAVSYSDHTDIPSNPIPSHSSLSTSPVGHISYKGTNKDAVAQQSPSKSLTNVTSSSSNLSPGLSSILSGSDNDSFGHIGRINDKSSMASRVPSLPQFLEQSALSPSTLNRIFNQNILPQSLGTPLTQQLQGPHDTPLHQYHTVNPKFHHTPNMTPAHRVNSSQSVVKQTSVLNPSLHHHLLQRNVFGDIMALNGAHGPGLKSPSRVNHKSIPKTSQIVDPNGSRSIIVDQLAVLNGARNGTLGRDSLPRASVSHVPSKSARKKPAADGQPDINFTNPPFFDPRQTQSGMPRGHYPNVVEQHVPQKVHHKRISNNHTTCTDSYGDLPGQSTISGPAAMPPWKSNADDSVQKSMSNEAPFCTNGQSLINPSGMQRLGASSDLNKSLANNVFLSNGSLSNGSLSNGFLSKNQYNPHQKSQMPVYNPQSTMQSVYHPNIVMGQSEAPNITFTNMGPMTEHDRQAQLWQMMNSCPATYPNNVDPSTHRLQQKIPHYPLSSYNFQPNSSNVFFSG